MVSIPTPRPSGLASRLRPVRVATIATLTSHRAVVVAVADALAWLPAVAAGALLATDLHLTVPEASSLLGLTVLAAASQLTVGAATGLYRRRHPRGSLDEARLLLGVVLLVGAVLAAATLVTSPDALPSLVPSPLGVGTPLAATVVAFLLTGGARAAARGLRERAERPAAGAARTVVFGAGQASASFVATMLRDRRSPWLPVALLDDDERLRRLSVRSVPVLGTRHDVAEVARRTGASVLVIAVASPPAELVQHLRVEAARAGLSLLVIPTVTEMLRDGQRVSDLRQVTAEDIIGRRPLDLDLEAAASYLRGARVLVTGAGGSIGSELCRQIAALAPAELIMLDRDETALQGVQVSIAGHGLLDTDDVVLADIRDAAAIEAVFVARRPEVVFHAAALKHLPMLEQYPAEGWKTNVLGTLNVLRAAQAVGVETFVNVSTDKAANASSALGRSKRLAERLTADAARATGSRYLSVRFGNVLGSRGSMLPLFQGLIEAGRPLTVTDPEATRYFMTIPEACHLVVQAGGIGRPGEVLILDMGEPVKILDIARRLIDLSGRDVEIVFTGLRPGEKLHEELVGDGEHDERPTHPSISHTTVPPLSAAELEPALYAPTVLRVA